MNRKFNVFLVSALTSIALTPLQLLAVDRCYDSFQRGDQFLIFPQKNEIEKWESLLSEIIPKVELGVYRGTHRVDEKIVFDEAQITQFIEEGKSTRMVHHKVIYNSHEIHLLRYYEIGPDYFVQMVEKYKEIFDYSSRLELNDLKKVIPFWLDHFRSVLSRYQISVESLIEDAKNKTLDNKIKKELLGPFLMTGERSADAQKAIFAPWNEIQNQFVTLLQKKMNLRDRKFTIALAGTHENEVLNTISAVHSALKKISWMKGIDADTFIKTWNISINGYSIRSEILFYIKNALRKHNLRSWVNLHYMDLLDPQQLNRLVETQPDVVFTANSLYISEHFSNLQRGMPKNEDTELLRDYLNKIYLALPAGGLFITEATPFVDLYRNLFISIPSKDRPLIRSSGINIKK